MFSLVLAALLSVSAHAERCPQYGGKDPEAVVDVQEFKFFFYSRRGTSEDPDIMLVEKDGRVTDTQKVYFWSDDMSDHADFYNQNIDISCTFDLGFIAARYHSPEGRVYDYTRGDCRGTWSWVHPLACD